MNTIPHPARPLLHYNTSWEGIEEERVVWLAPGLLAEGKITILDGDPGVGKGLALDTPIPTPDGWTTMRDLSVGDRIYDDHGNVCRVTFATDVNVGLPCYRLTFSDGSSIVADDVHLWETTTRAERHRATSRAWKVKHRIDTGRKPRKDTRADGSSIRSTQEIAESCRLKDGRANHAIRACAPLSDSVWARPAPRPIPAYTLGLWLADGTSASGGITKPDQEVFDEVERDGFTVAPFTEPSRARTVYGLCSLLRSAGLLNNKHIPVPYLRGNPDTRRALLAGLLDGDGYQSPRGIIEFTTTTPALRDGAMELIRSLGYIPFCGEGRATLNGRDIGPKWRITFSAEQSPFRLPRKRDAFVAGRRATCGQRYIISCEPVDSVPTRCIQVDSRDRMYLAGEAMIPTHNTTAWVDWAARISSGRAIPGGDERPPGGVLVFNGEDTVADTLKPRARIHGAHMPNMHSIDVKPDGTPFLIPNDLWELEQLIATLNIRLVIFDPIYSFMNADMTKSQQVRQALVQLQAVLSRRRLPCLFLRHLNKNSQSSESMYRGEGSIALNAVARVVLQAGFHPADPELRVIANTKTNIGKGTNSLAYRIEAVDGEQHGKLTWEGSANVSANELLAPSNRNEREDRQDLWDWAQGKLPITGDELDKRCKEAGIKPDQVKEVLRQHGAKHKPRGSGGKWEWHLPTPAYDHTVSLECVECGGTRQRGEESCPNCGAKPMKIVRT